MALARGYTLLRPSPGSPGRSDLSPRKSGERFSACVSDRRRRGPRPHLCHRRAGQGRPAHRRQPDRRSALGLAPNLLLWAALVAGSAAGALAYAWINLAAIWFAAG